MKNQSSPTSPSSSNPQHEGNRPILMISIAQLLFSTIILAYIYMFTKLIIESPLFDILFFTLSFLTGIRLGKHFVNELKKKTS